MNKESEQDGDQATAVARGSEPGQKAGASQKQIVTIRLDGDLLTWFKQAGPGYQTRINQLLREHMDAQRSALEVAG